MNNEFSGGSLPLNRRSFLKRAGGATAALAFGPSMAAVLSACGSDGEAGPGTSPTRATQTSGRPIRYGHLNLAVQAATYGTVETPDGPGTLIDGDLVIEFSQFNAGPEMSAALVAGDLDFAETGLVPQVFSALNELPILTLGGGTVHARGFRPITAMIVQADSDIAHFTDLEGKRVAIAAFGALADIELRQLEEFYGLDRQRFEVVVLPYSDMNAALEAGNVDAALQVEPLVTIGETTGLARYLASSTDAVAHMLTQVNVAHEDFVAQRPGDAQALMRRMLETSRWIAGNETSWRAIAQEKFDLPPEVADKFSVGYFLQNGAISERSILSQLRLMRELDIVPTEYPDEDAFIKRWFRDPVTEVLDPVLAEIGEVPDEVEARFESDPLPLV